MTFEEAVQWLRRHFPVDVEVERKILGSLGCTKCVNDRFCIEINHSMPLGFQIETLLHEWAHMLTWPNGHSDNWGRVYAQIYRTFEVVYIFNTWKKNDSFTLTI